MDIQTIEIIKTYVIMKSFLFQFIVVVLCLVSCNQNKLIDDYELNMCSLTRATSNIEWDDCIFCNYNGSELRLPWANPSPTGIPDYIRTDVRQEDGWKILYSTVNIVNSDIPFVTGANTAIILLYNRFTGVLKGFVYMNNVHPNNTAFWILSLSSGSKLFNFQKDFALAQNESGNPSNIVLTNVTNNYVTQGFENGWNCFLTELAYDPNSMNEFLDITAYTLNQTTYKFTGAYNLTSSGTIISETGHTGSSIVNGIASATGSVAKNWIANNTGANKAIRSESISKIIQSIANSSVTSLVKAGVNLVFGSLLGGSQKSGISTLELQTNGKVSLDGGSQIPSTVNGATISGIPLNGIGEPLGVWNIESKPQCNYDEYAELVETTQRPAGQDYECIYKLNIKPFYNFVKNPYLGYNISHTAQIVEYTIQNGLTPKWFDILSNKTYMCNYVNYQGKNTRETLYSDSTTCIKSINNPVYVSTTGMMPDRKSLDNKPVRDFLTGTWEARTNIALKITMTMYMGGATYISCKTFVPEINYQSNTSARPYTWSYSELKNLGY